MEPSKQELTTADNPDQAEQTLVATEESTAPAGMANNKQMITVPSSDAVSPIVAIIQSSADFKVNDVTQIRELYDIQKQWEADQAVKAYNMAMSQAMVEIPTIVKNMKNDHLNSTYADLGAMIKGAGPVISKYGLACTFRHDQQEREGWVITYCRTTHAQGHSEEYRVEFPIMEPIRGGKGAATNPAQMIGNSMTYGKRYSFAGAFSIATEDNDACVIALSQPAVKLINEKQASAIADLLVSLNEHQESFMKRWKAHYSSSWDESDEPPGLEIPASEYGRVIGELKAKLKGFQEAPAQ